MSEKTTADTNQHVDHPVECIGNGDKPDPGVARIKPEYIRIFDSTPHLEIGFAPKKLQDQLSAKRIPDDESVSDEPSKPKCKKLKGQFKKRPREKPSPPGDRLCRFIVAGENCPYTDNCCFLHDVSSYLSKKLPDLEGRCHNFDTLGKCSYGITCRFAKNHLTNENANVVDVALWEKTVASPTVLNTLSKELQAKLSRKKYNFEKADAAYKIVNAFVKRRREQKSKEVDMLNGITKDDLISKKTGGISNIDQKSLLSSLEIQKHVQESATLSEIEQVATVSTNADEVSAKFGPILDTDIIKLRPAEKRTIDFSNKLYLAPLTTVGNLPFRRICKKFGADITCGEMAMCFNLLQGQSSEWALLRRHECEDLFGVQVCGAHPDTMMRCAQLMNENITVDFVDINMGCPIDFVYNKGMGCGLMNSPSRLERIIRGMDAVLDCPVTLKMRTGVCKDKNIAHNLIRKISDWGLGLITMHGRSRQARYCHLADWDYISRCAQIAAPIPFFGGGDVLSYEDYNLRISSAGVSGIMIGRGALYKPWLFTEIKEQRHWDISSSERLDILRDFVKFGFENWGSDSAGIEKTRRFLLEWLSFLHRYIPVGLLEHVPQKMNQRPPHYVGRDDLETLMASPSCCDWIKITEMILGPTPDNFVFLPKHKASAFKS